MMQQEAGKDQVIHRGQGPQTAGQQRTYEKPQLVVLGAEETEFGVGAFTDGPHSPTLVS
ncbi:MAG: hypothetical protein ACO3TH_11220 [Lutimaribacter sp.]|jgi:hypothetical protein